MESKALAAEQPNKAWHALAILLAGIGLATYAAWDGLVYMVDGWSREEYSYGYFVPFLIGFFIWQRKQELVSAEPASGWPGLVLTAAGIVILLFGELSALFVLTQYGYLVTLHGLALAYLGWNRYRLIAIPLAMLFLTVPLPEFLYNNLSQSLQLVSSQIGVWVIRLFGISVFLEGNVIHLATMQLQVVEACSGLRYLFPLMAVGFMVAYLYDAPLWKRAFVFASTVPITVLMNSFRIGLIGVSVEYWGSEMAEGLLHDFEGWVVFMASLAVLLFEMWVLNKLGRDKRSFNDAFRIDLPPPLAEGTQLKAPQTLGPVIMSAAIVLLGFGAVAAAPHRVEVLPDRLSFADFPMRIGSWQGQTERLDPIFADVLKLDDYLLASFKKDMAPPVNLYSAFYGSQRKGASVHSPQSCMPGDGWEMEGLDTIAVEGATVNGQPLRVNRVLIRKGEHAQLVYYWFQQRGRIITNEYLVKWYLFQDALTRQRTDGALVRLVTPVPRGETITAADERLTEFAELVAGRLESYIPN